jgi:general secretion pathway protein C
VDRFVTISRLGIWIVNAALFALCCFLTAGLANAWIAAWLAAAPVAAPTTTAAAGGPARAWSDRLMILDRNLFQVSTLLPPEQAPEVAPELTEEELEATRLPLKLLGTVSANEQKASYAAVEDQQSHKQIVVRVDDRLLDKATVIRIERRRIVLQNGAKREELVLDDDDVPGGGARMASRAARPVAPPPPVADDLRDRIQRLSEGNFQVDRQDVEEAVRNPAELFSEARILPKYENGAMVGVQLSSIKPGSLFEEIGIMNGDTVMQVNGITVTSPQDSAALLKELTSASDFQVQILGADGQTRALTYSIGE